MTQRQAKSSISSATKATPQRARAKQRRNWRPKFIAALIREGTVTAACEYAAINRSTAYRERQANEDFALLWADAEQAVTDKLEKRAVELALDGDTRLLEFLLKARRPEHYRETHRVEHSGTIKHDVTTMTQDELTTLAGQLATLGDGD